jgi:hypothetical protein
LHIKIQLAFISISEMIPASVLMRATFERAGESSGGQGSLHITNDSHFLPPDDVVEMLERHGQQIVVEQTLDAAKFHLLFRDMSKQFAGQPKKEVALAGRPKSLVTTCANAVPHTIRARYVASQPKEIAEVLACNLPPEELSDFVLTETSLKSLKQSYSIDGIQMFLLHFLKTYSRDDLPDYVKREMKVAKKSIASQCYKLSLSNKTTKREYSKFCHIDWTFVALGCFTQFLSVGYNTELEYIFFLLKFRQQQQCIRSPVPHVPFCLSRLIPEQECLLDQLASVDEFEKNTREYRPRKTKHEEFMVCMTAIAENAWRGAHHEVLAYAALVLCNDDMLHNPYWKKYYFFVWGELAVSLAKLNMPESFSQSCLAKMKEYAVKCISFELDSLLYEQKVASAYRHFTKEKKLMKLILSLVPKHSRFYRNSLMVHLSSRKREFENMLAFAYVVRLEETDEANAFFGFDIRQSSTAKFLDLIEDQLAEHKQLMHKACATFKNGFKNAIFHQHLLLVQMYDDVMSFMKYGWTMKRTWRMNEACLANSTCHERHFVSFHTKFTDEHTYKREMLAIKRELELQTKVVNHQTWADICFTHFLLIQTVNNNSNTNNSNNSLEILEFFRQEAIKIYDFHNNHFRKVFLVDAVRHNFSLKNSSEEEDEPKIEPHCTIQWIIRNAPNVKKLIRLGISSADRFDIWSASFIWQRMN